LSKTKTKNRNVEICTSSGNDEWETPQEFFDKLNHEFHFTLDACATKYNAKCKKYYTKEDNALIQDWSNEIVYMNPPYSTKQQNAFVKKAYEESQKGAIVVCLLPARTSTKRFHEYCLKGEIRLLKGRLKFVGAEASAPFPSMVVIFKPPGISKIIQKKKNKIEIIDPFRNEPIAPLLNKPPMVRMGGKRYLSEYLINKINKFDYSMYIEAFFGGGRVYFEKNSHFMEIINDKESRVSNFFYCARNFPEELTRLQSLLVKDENTFKRLYDHYHDPHNTEYEDIKRARLLWEKYKDQESKVLLIHKAIDFYYYSNMGFRGSLTARTMTYFENDPRTENNRMRWRIFRPLEWLGNRMRRTMVLNQDFSRIIKLGLRYHNHSRIWFFDPPYWKTEPYELPFEWKQYEILNECLKQIPETDYFILTLNIDEKLRKL